MLLRALHGRVSMLSAIVGRMAAKTVRNRKTEQEALSAGSPDQILQRTEENFGNCIARRLHLIARSWP